MESNNRHLELDQATWEEIQDFDTGAIWMATTILGRWYSGQLAYDRRLFDQFEIRYAIARHNPQAAARR